MLVLAKDIFVLLFNILAATCRATFRFFCPVRKDLSGQVAVITGAGRGIGRELAREFCAKGCDLALVDMDAEALAETKNTIHTSNTVTTYTCDITSSENVQRVAAEVLKEHGRADILVNNAGIINIKDILSLSEREITRCINVNALAHFWTVRAFLPNMLQRNSGHIVTIGNTFYSYNVMTSFSV